MDVNRLALLRLPLKDLHVPLVAFNVFDVVLGPLIVESHASAEFPVVERSRLEIDRHVSEMFEIPGLAILDVESLDMILLDLRRSMNIECSLHVRIMPPFLSFRIHISQTDAEQFDQYIVPQGVDMDGMYRILLESLP